MNQRERRLQEYLDGKLGIQERAAFEAEAMDSAETAEDLMHELSLRELVARRRRRRLRRSPRRRFAAAAMGLAAAAALVLLWPRGEAPEPVLRSTGDAAIEALAPVGTLEDPPTTFRWREFAPASTYRIEIFDADGLRIVDERVEGASFTADGSTPLPLVGFWQVTAMDSVGLEIARSEPIRFEAPSLD